MAILLVAALLGGLATTAPAVSAAAPQPSHSAGVGDTWDLQNDSCARQLVLRGSVLETVDEIDFHVENHASDVPISRIEVSSGRSAGGTGVCHDSATAPPGWMAQVQDDGTAVFVAQSPADVVERGGRLFGFKIGRRSGGDCCQRHRGYGPGFSTIRDDDDVREDCSCNLVSVTAASWTQAKFLYR